MKFGDVPLKNTYLKGQIFGRFLILPVFVTTSDLSAVLRVTNPNFIALCDRQTSALFSCRTSLQISTVFIVKNGFNFIKLIGINVCGK